jgi:Ca2+-transporting ATPase
MVFTVLSFAQLAHVVGIRSDWEYIHEKGFFTNKPLLFAILLTCVLQLGVIYIPFANEIFKTQPLSIAELFTCIGIASTVFVAVEIEKWVKRRKHK